MELVFLRPSWLWLLALLPALFLYSQKHLSGRMKTESYFFLIIVRFSSLILITLALAGPSTIQTTIQKTPHLMIGVDVSKSVNAEKLLPKIKEIESLTKKQKLLSCLMVSHAA